MSVGNATGKYGGAGSIGIRLSFGIFLSTLVLAPVLFGSVETWSRALLQMMICLSVAAFFLNVRSTEEPVLYRMPGLIPLSLYIGLLVFQLIPLPPVLLEFISPQSARVRVETSMLVASQSWYPLTADLRASAQTFSLHVSLALFYLLGIQLLSSGKRMRLTVKFIVYFAALIAFLSFLNRYLDTGRLFFLRSFDGSTFGPYVNRNHYAGFMIMVFPLAAGLFYWKKPYVPYETLKEKIIGVYGQKSFHTHLLLGFCLFLIGVSVVVSLSRGGLVALGFSMIIMGGLLLFRERRRGIFLLTVFALLLPAVGWFGWEPILDRFGLLASDESLHDFNRLDIWKDALAMVSDYPVFGAGAGTFGLHYPLYRSLDGALVVDHAHNDYLELLSESGVVGFVLITFFIAVIVLGSFRMWRKRSESYVVHLYMGALAALFAVLVHAIVDFNFQIPANALYFVLLCIMCVSLANTRMRKNLGRTKLPALSAKYVPVFRRTILAGAIMVFLFQGMTLAGDAAFSSARNTEHREGDSFDVESVLKPLAFASAIDPLNGLYHFALGNAELRAGNAQSAEAHFRRAVVLEPLRGTHLQRLAESIEDPLLAERLMRAGAKYAARSTFPYYRYVIWLLGEGHRQRALTNIRLGLTVQPGSIGKYFPVFERAGFSTEEILSVMPQRAEPLITLGQYWERKHMIAEAEIAYQRGLDAIVFEPVINPYWLLGTTGFYTRQRRYDDAITVMRQALVFYPSNKNVRVVLGGLYETTGVEYRAVEEYEQALMLDPTDVKIRQRLKRLQERSLGKSNK